MNGRFLLAVYTVLFRLIFDFLRICVAFQIYYVQCVHQGRGNLMLSRAWIHKNQSTVPQWSHLSSNDCVCVCIFFARHLGFYYTTS